MISIAEEGKEEEFMVQINFGERKAICKIVYYGPGGCGKKTTLHALHKSIPEDRRGEILCTPTDGGEILSLDIFSIDGTNFEIGKLKTILQIYTFSGSISNAAKQELLHGTDGIIFIADSGEDKMEENISSLKELEKILQVHGMDLRTIPLVMQWNKRDLGNAMKAEELKKILNSIQAPSFATVASKEQGVFPSLEKIMEIIWNSLNKPHGSSGIANRREISPAAPPIPQPPLPGLKEGELPGTEKSISSTDQPDLLGAKEEEKVKQWKEIQRKTTVRYYSQMNPFQSFPLMVMISKEQIQKIEMAGVTQVESAQSFSVQKKMPFIKIIPYFPGSILTPTVVEVDVSPDEVKAKMWVTPLSEGEFKESRIEIWYRGKIINTVYTPCVVQKTTVAKIMVALSFLLPVITSSLKAFGLDPESQIQSGFPLVKTIFSILTMTHISGILLVVFLTLSLVLYQKSRAKESDPVVAFFAT